MSNTHLLPFENTIHIQPKREEEEVESHGDGLARPIYGGPESPCSDGIANFVVHKEQDKFLPIANVGRIMKKVIPANGKISKDAKEIVQECVSEFISFVTGEASDKCQREKRKTVNGDDIIWAMITLGFENYVSPLKIYLNKYREIEGEKLTIPKQQQQHQQQQQFHHQRMNQIAMFGGAGLAPFLSPASVYSSQSTLTHHQSPFVGGDQAFSLPFSPSDSVHKPYHQHPEQIDSLDQW